MTVEYHSSTVTKMDLDDSKTGSTLHLVDGSKLQYTVYVLRNRPFRVAAVCLGVLCVLLLAGVIGQAVQYRRVNQENQHKFDAVSEEKITLQERLANLQTESRIRKTDSDHLREKYDTLNKRKSQLENNYKLLNADTNSLKVDQARLQANNSALNKQMEQLKVSRDQLQTDNKALSTAKDLLQTQYDLVVKRKNELQVSYNSATKERDNLLNKYNNATRSKIQLQMSYDAMREDLEYLEGKHNVSASEKEKLASSHQSLTAAKDSLQNLYETLQNSYVSVVQEKETLQKKLANVTEERDQLQIQVEGMNRTLQDRRCPADWKKFQHKCYYSSLSKKTWKLSRSYCQSKGADLAIITDPSEMAFINSLYKSDTEVWIGLTDEGVEGQWKWVDGTPLTTAYWGKGQPNNYNGRDQDCVEFWHRSSGTGEWNDEGCDFEQNWICEM